MSSSDLPHEYSDPRESIPEVNIEDVRTGDCLFFGSFSCGGVVVRLFTSSQWNHVAIAVRVLPNGKISTGPEGKLCAIESGSYPRLDVFSGEKKVGVTAVDFMEIAKEYSVASARHIRRSLLTDKYGLLVEKFIREYNGREFPGMMPFISVWAGLPIERKGNDLFCSELAAHFYQYCAYPVLLEQMGPPPSLDEDGGPLEEDHTNSWGSHPGEALRPEKGFYPEHGGGSWDVKEIKSSTEDHSSMKRIIMGLDEDGRLDPIFGPWSPHLAQLYSPQILSKDGTPQSLVLTDEQQTIWRREDSAQMILTQHVMIVLAVAFVGIMAVKGSMGQ